MQELQGDEVLFIRALWHSQHTSVSTITEFALGKYMSQWFSVKDDMKDVIYEFGYQVLKIPAFDRFSYSPVVEFLPCGLYYRFSDRKCVLYNMNMLSYVVTLMSLFLKTKWI